VGQQVDDTGHGRFRHPIENFFDIQDKLGPIDESLALFDREQTPVVTGNTKHFANIEGLETTNWLK
jgi:hypothetical protein